MKNDDKILLSLDMAGTTGYCIRWDDGSIKCGILTLTRGMKNSKARSPLPMARLWRRLGTFLDQVRPDAIVFEETFGRGAAKFRLDSLQFALILQCVLRQIPYMQVSPSLWKKAVLGKGSIKKEEYWQAAIDKWPDLIIHRDDVAAALWLMEFYLTCSSES